jgi:hypothetical protein
MTGSMRRRADARSRLRYERARERDDDSLREGASHWESTEISHHDSRVGIPISRDDPFFLDDQLSEDERLIRETARAHSADKLMPRVTEAYLCEKTGS